jgi:hypothetical protein
MIKKELAEETVELLVNESKGLKGTICLGLGLLTTALEFKGFDRDKLRAIGLEFMQDIKKLETDEDKEKDKLEVEPKTKVSSDKIVEIVEALKNDTESYAGTLSTGLSLLALAIERKGYDSVDIAFATDKYLFNITKITTREQDMKALNDMLFNN